MSEKSHYFNSCPDAAPDQTAQFGRTEREGIFTCSVCGEQVEFEACHNCGEAINYGNCGWCGHSDNDGRQGCCGDGTQENPGNDGHWF